MKEFYNDMKHSYSFADVRCYTISYGVNVDTLLFLSCSLQVLVQFWEVRWLMFIKSCTFILLLFTCPSPLLC